MILTREQVERERAEELLRAKPRTDMLNALDTIDARDAEIATLKSAVDSWKREEVIRDEWEARNESERIEWVQRGERAEERCKELEAKIERLDEENMGLAHKLVAAKAKIERLVAAGDKLHGRLIWRSDKVGDIPWDCAAWTAAKEE